MGDDAEVIPKPVSPARSRPECPPDVESAGIFLWRMRRTSRSQLHGMRAQLILPSFSCVFDKEFRLQHIVRRGSAVLPILPKVPAAMQAPALRRASTTTRLPPIQSPRTTTSPILDHVLKQSEDALRNAKNSLEAQEKLAEQRDVLLPILSSYSKDVLRPMMADQLKQTGTIRPEVLKEEMALGALYRSVDTTGQTLSLFTSKPGEPLRIAAGVKKQLMQEIELSNEQLHFNVRVRDAALLSPEDRAALGFELEPEETAQADALASMRAQDGTPPMSAEEYMALRLQVHDRCSVFNALNGAADLATCLRRPTEFTVALSPLEKGIQGAAAHLAKRPEYVKQNGEIFRGVSSTQTAQALKAGHCIPFDRLTSTTNVPEAAYNNLMADRRIGLKITLDSKTGAAGAIDASSFHAPGTISTTLSGSSPTNPLFVVGHGEHLILPGQHLQVTKVTTDQDGNRAIEGVLLPNSTKSSSVAMHVSGLVDPYRSI